VQLAEGIELCPVDVNPLELEVPVIEGRTSDDGNTNDEGALLKRLLDIL